MGRITDAVIAIIVLVIGLWILTRLGIRLGTIITMASIRPEVVFVVADGP